MGVLFLMKNLDTLQKLLYISSIFVSNKVMSLFVVLSSHRISGTIRINNCILIWFLFVIRVMMYGDSGFGFLGPLNLGCSDFLNVTWKR